MFDLQTEILTKEKSVLCLWRGSRGPGLGAAPVPSCVWGRKGERLSRMHRWEEEQD